MLNGRTSITAIEAMRQGERCSVRTIREALHHWSWSGSSRSSPLRPLAADAAAACARAGLAWAPPPVAEESFDGEAPDDRRPSVPRPVSDAGAHRAQRRLRRRRRRRRRCRQRLQRLRREKSAPPASQARPRPRPRPLRREVGDEPSVRVLDIAQRRDGVQPGLVRALPPDRLGLPRREHDLRDPQRHEENGHDELGDTPQEHELRVVAPAPRADAAEDQPVPRDDEEGERHAEGGAGREGADVVASALFQSCP